MTATTKFEARPKLHLRTVDILRCVVVASIVLPMLILATAGMLTWRDRQRDAWDRTIRLTDLVYESVSKLIDAQIMATEQAQLMIGGLDDDAIAADEPSVHQRLHAMLRHLPHLLEIFVVDRTGHAIVTASRYPAPHKTSLANRDYYQYFKNGGPGLFVGAPGSRYVDNLRFFPLAAARPPIGGQFAGVIAVSVNPDYFAAFFRDELAAYDDDANRSISLRRGDGLLLVRSEPLPEQGQEASQAFAKTMYDPARLSGHTISDWSGAPRLIAWRRLPMADMVVVTSVAQHDVVAAWMRMMAPYAVFGLLTTIALATMTGVALRRTIIAEIAEHQAEQERQRRRQAEEAIRLGQKMEALGKLTGGVAHDFNNLLAVILGSAELAKKRPPEKVHRLLDAIRHAAERGAALTRQLLSFSRTQATEPRVLEPRQEVPRIMQMLKTSLRGDVEVVTTVADDVWRVEADPGEWEIAMLNIAVNARDVMPSGGRLTVDVRNHTLRAGDVPTMPTLEGDFVRIALRDTGYGISPEIAARAFDPFFTTKDVGRGTGLGLSQVYGFARQAGGAATIEPGGAATIEPGGAVTIEPGSPNGTAGGTIVTLYLPRTEKPLPDADPVAVAQGPAVADARRILLVEDNQEVAAITTEIIQTFGYEVVTVDRAHKALEKLNQDDAAFHLLLTDVVMPDGMNGLELARTVRASRPRLPIVLMSGYNEAVPAGSAEFTMLRKPLPVDVLRKAIEAELRGFPRIVVDNTRQPVQAT